MRDSDDRYDKDIALIFVEDAVIADPQPPQAAQVALKCTAEKRIVCKAVDCGGDPGPFRFGDAAKLPGRAALNLN